MAKSTNAPRAGQRAAGRDERLDPSIAQRLVHGGALDFLAVARAFLTELADPDEWKDALPAWARTHRLTADQVRELRVAVLRVRVFDALDRALAPERPRRAAQRVRGGR